MKSFKHFINEGRNSEYSANQQLSSSSNRTPGHYLMKNGVAMNKTPHLSSSAALKAYNALPSKEGVKIHQIKEDLTEEILDEAVHHDIHKALLSHPGVTKDGYENQAGAHAYWLKNKNSSIGSIAKTLRKAGHTVHVHTGAHDHDVVVNGSHKGHTYNISGTRAAMHLRVHKNDSAGAHDRRGIDSGDWGGRGA
jgi:hypothetical protein